MCSRRFKEMSFAAAQLNSLANIFVTTVVAISKTDKNVWQKNR